MNSFTGPSLGCSRAGRFLSGGTALASACRTIRRWTPSFFATARIVPAPCSNSRRNGREVQGKERAFSRGTTIKHRYGKESLVLPRAAEIIVLLYQW